MYRDSVGRSYIFICLIGLFSYFSYNLIRTPVLPLFAQHLGAAPELIGLVVSVSTVTGIFVKLPAGIAADLLGRRLVLLAGVLVFSVMPFAYVFVRHIGVLLGVRAVHGLATALFAPVSMAVVADFYPGQGGARLGWYFASTQTGKLLGPIAGGFLLGLWGFTPTFVLCGLIGGVLLVLAFSMPAWDRHERSRSGPTRPGPTGLSALASRFGTELRGVMADFRVLAVSAMEAVQMMAAGALMAFLPIYGMDVGLGAAQVGLLFGVQGVSALINKPLTGGLSDRLGRRPLIIAGLLLSALSFSMIPAVSDFYGLLFLAALFGLGEALVISSTSALVADLWRTKSLGSAMGAYGTIMDVGHASGPLLAGVLIAALGYLSAFRLIGLILLLGLAGFLVAVREEPRGG